MPNIYYLFRIYDAKLPCRMLNLNKLTKYKKKSVLDKSKKNKTLYLK